MRSQFKSPQCGIFFDIVILGCYVLNVMPLFPGGSSLWWAAFFISGSVFCTTAISWDIF